MSRADLEADYVRTFGLVKLIEIVGEAARRLTREFQVEHSTVPWSDIIGMRHKLVHDYDRIELDVVWETLTVDLPALVAYVEPLVPPWTEDED